MGSIAYEMLGGLLRTPAQFPTYGNHSEWKADCLAFAEKRDEDEKEGDPEGSLAYPWLLAAISIYSDSLFERFKLKPYD